YLNSPGLQFHSQRICQRLQRIFRCRIGTQQWNCATTGNRPHIDNATSASAQQRKKRLRDSDLPDHIDLKLFPQLRQWYDLQGTSDHDPGIIDEPSKASLAYNSLHHLDGSCDRWLIRDIYCDRDDRRTALRNQRLPCLRGAHTGKYRHPTAGTIEGTSRTDASRGTSNNNCHGNVDLVDLVHLVHLVHLVCFVYLVDLVRFAQPKRPNKQDKPNKQDARVPRQPIREQPPRM